MLHWLQAGEGRPGRPDLVAGQEVQAKLPGHAQGRHRRPVLLAQAHGSQGAAQTEGRGTRGWQAPAGEPGPRFTLSNLFYSQKKV